jgi:hypothetical protein
MTPSFFTSSYLYHCCLFLFFSFKNSECGLPQLEHPKGAKAHNATWHPKVAKVSNNIQRPKATKSNNATVNIFYPFPSFSIFLLSILQNTIINKAFIWISPLH